MKKMNNYGNKVMHEGKDAMLNWLNLWMKDIKDYKR